MYSKTLNRLSCTDLHVHEYLFLKSLIAMYWLFDTLNSVWCAHSFSLAVFLFIFVHFLFLHFVAWLSASEFIWSPEQDNVINKLCCRIFIFRCINDETADGTGTGMDCVRIDGKKLTTFAAVRRWKSFFVIIILLWKTCNLCLSAHYSIDLICDYYYYRSLGRLEHSLRLWLLL